MVVCESVPEVAVTVTVEVPSGTGLEPGAAPVELAQPERLRVRRKREDAPPRIEGIPKVFLLLRIAGRNEKSPRGKMAPASFSPVPPDK